LKIKDIIKPKRLKKGDTVSIISPASPISREKLERGISYLENLGYNVKLGRHIYAKKGYLSGIDEKRVSDLHELFCDNDVKAIFCSRGGYGSIRILDLVDYELIRRNPKIFIGFSDITALEVSIFTKTGLLTFYGPMIAPDSNNEMDFSAFDFLFKIITSQSSFYKINISNQNVVKKGRSKGILIGGCLSVFSSLLGTEYIPNLENAIIFFEDIDEEPYRIDKYLNQLRLCGLFDNASGFVFGKFVNCESRQKNYKGPTVDEVINDIISNLKVPVIKNFDFGHIKGKLTIPMGIKATIDTDKLYISFDENAVI
jgi:muramoyltetrapeptide carboxypeptidase